MPCTLRAIFVSKMTLCTSGFLLLPKEITESNKNMRSSSYLPLPISSCEKLRRFSRNLRLLHYSMHSYDVLYNLIESVKKHGGRANLWDKSDISDTFFRMMIWRMVIQLRNNKITFHGNFIHEYTVTTFLFNFRFDGYERWTTGAGHAQFGVETVVNIHRMEYTH